MSAVPTVLHQGRIKERFGENRRFMVRCDQFPASCAHFLNQLSGLVDTGIENPKSLAPLPSSLSSNEPLVVLDSAESILCLRGPDAGEVYDGRRRTMHSIESISLTTNHLSLTTPLNNSTLIHFRWLYWPPSHIKTSRMEAYWPGSRNSAK